MEDQQNWFKHQEYTCTINFGFLHLLWHALCEAFSRVGGDLGFLLGLHIALQMVKSVPQQIRKFSVSAALITSLMCLPNLVVFLLSFRIATFNFKPQRRCTGHSSVMQRLLAKLDQALDLLEKMLVSFAP